VNLGLKNIRIHTGIPALDPFIEGGFFLPSLDLLLGPPGSGKTTFSMQYLFEGAKNREKGLLFSTLSQTSASLVQLATNYWFIDTRLLGTKIFMVDLSRKLQKIKKGDDLLQEIITKIKYINPTRLVIDPINLIQLTLADLKEYRVFIFELSKFIKQHNIHVVLVAELYKNDYHCHESFISDGTLLFQMNKNTQGISRRLTIVKMRGTTHPLEPIEYSISNNGIQLRI
jgi:KaiC/GvpD/RAD55 family RecA-like ATPase